MIREWEDQSFLVAVATHGGKMTLAALGDRAQAEFDESVIDPLDDLGGKEALAQPGLHVWEGKLIGESSNTDLHRDYEWQGIWRPAMQADLARFGLASLE